MDSRTCQTSTASPAEPGGFPASLGLNQWFAVHSKRMALGLADDLLKNIMLHSETFVTRVFLSPVPIRLTWAE